MIIVLLAAAVVATITFEPAEASCKGHDGLRGPSAGAVAQTHSSLDPLRQNPQASKIRLPNQRCTLTHATRRGVRASIQNRPNGPGAAEWSGVRSTGTTTTTVTCCRLIDAVRLQQLLYNTAVCSRK